MTSVYNQILRTLGYKLLSPKGFELSISRMPGHQVKSPLIICNWSKRYSLEQIHLKGIDKKKNVRIAFAETPTNGRCRRSSTCKIQDRCDRGKCSKCHHTVWNISFSKINKYFVWVRGELWVSVPLKDKHSCALYYYHKNFQLLLLTTATVTYLQILNSMYSISELKLDKDILF